MKKKWSKLTDSSGVKITRIVMNSASFALLLSVAFFSYEILEGKKETEVIVNNLKEIQNSLSTQYLGLFPEYISNINILLEKALDETKKNGGRVICVGTTSCRTIESAAAEDGTLQECSGWTEIFIYPGYQFKVIDALITNFHLPESTLVMLVSALAGREHVLTAYAKAVEEGYRFFSFGDAMFITDISKK